MNEPKNPTKPDLQIKGKASSSLTDQFLYFLSDLILKMQDSNSLTRNYQKQGIVLIDEIETHLHLELQRLVMPLLTKIFPNIQFIVTTHSPFVLSSMPNAIAYDLEHREIIEELTEYSYESLAEGYFGVKTNSSYMEMRLNSLEDLLKKESCRFSISFKSMPFSPHWYRQLPMKRHVNF